MDHKEKLNKRIIDKLFYLIICLLLFLPSFGFNLLIDSGHSQKSKGAMSCTGKYEYIYNDELVEVIYNYIKMNNKNITAEVSRGPFDLISLKERAFLTSEKDLLISIHHDSVQEKYLKTININNKTITYSNKYKGYSLLVNKRSSFYNFSFLFAQILGKNLKYMGFTPSMHHSEKIHGENRPLIDQNLGIYDYDNLYLLNKSECPAIILEAGIIVNTEEEETLSQIETKQKISRAVSDSIKQYMEILFMDFSDKYFTLFNYNQYTIRYNDRVNDPNKRN